MGKTKASWAPQCRGGGEPGAGGWRARGITAWPAQGEGALCAGFPGQESLGPTGNHIPPPHLPKLLAELGPQRGPFAVTCFLVSKPTGPSPGPLQEGVGRLRLCTPESHVLSAWTPHGHTGQHVTGSRCSSDPLNCGQGEELCSPRFTGEEAAAQPPSTGKWH